MMEKHLKTTALVMLLLTVSPAWSLDQEEINQTALKNTQEVLTNKKLREKEALKTENAKHADHAADQVVGGNGQQKEEMYAISAELMKWIVDSTGGDVDKMNKLLQEAQQDPEAFYAKMPAEQRDKIKGLSKKIEDSKKKP